MRIIMHPLPPLSSSPHCRAMRTGGGGRFSFTKAFVVQQDTVAFVSLPGITLLATLTLLGSLEIQAPRNPVHWVGTLDLFNLLI